MGTRPICIPASVSCKAIQTKGCSDWDCDRVTGSRAARAAGAVIAKAAGAGTAMDAGTQLQLLQGVPVQ